MIIHVEGCGPLRLSVNIVSGIHRSLQSYELGTTASVASWDIAKRPSLCRQLSWSELITRDDRIASLLRKLDYLVPRR
jgi:hypothetical protein